MTRQQAMKRARSLCGPKALIRASEAISSPEKRSEATIKVLTARARITELEQEIAELLKGLDRYQSLMAEKRDMRAIVSANEGSAFYHKFSVGKDLGYAFLVEGSGDTWEEAFGQVERKRQSAKVG